MGQFIKAVTFAQPVGKASTPRGRPGFSGRRPAGWPGWGRRRTRPGRRGRAARSASSTSAATTSPGTIAGIPGGYGATSSARHPPDGRLASTVSCGAKNASRGSAPPPAARCPARRAVTTRRGCRRGAARPLRPARRRTARRSPRCRPWSRWRRRCRGRPARPGSRPRSGRPRPRSPEAPVPASPTASRVGSTLGRPVEDREAVDRAPAGRGPARHQPEVRPSSRSPSSASSRRAASMLATIARGRAGRVGRLEGALQAVGVEPLGPRQHQGSLGVGGQRLVGARDEGVGAGGEGVRRQVRVEPEVRGPRLVDDQRHARRRERRRPAPRRRSAPRRSRGRPRRRPGPRVLAQGLPQPVDRDAARQARRRGRRPAPPSAAAPPTGRSRAAASGAPRGSTRPGRPGAPTARASAWLPCVDPATEKRHQSAPHSARPRAAPPPGEQQIRVLDAVQPAVERRVTRGDRAGEVLPLLVPGHAHRGELPGVGLRGERQPGVQQRRVPPQPAGSPYIGAHPCHMPSVIMARLHDVDMRAALAAPRPTSRFPGRCRGVPGRRR